MTIDQFVAVSRLETLAEIDKVLRLAFYQYRKNGLQEFSITDCISWLVNLGFGRPNKSRLEGRLDASRDVVKGSNQLTFRLHHVYVKKLDSLYPNLAERSQQVIEEGSVLPASLYAGTRGYIETLARQINASYEHNIFDGCAVLMRRLEEILLIHSYEKLGIVDSIKDANGNYFLLESIVKNAVANTTLDLSRNSKITVEDIRKLGNYSAHKITYTCRREYIREKIADFRALVDELLHKSGIRT